MEFPDNQKYPEWNPARKQIVIPLKGAMELFGEYVATDFPGRRPATINNTIRDVQRMAFKWFKDRRYDISTETLTEYANYMYGKYTGHHAQISFGRLGRYLKWLERTGRVSMSPHRGVRTPLKRHSKPPRERKLFTTEDYIGLRQAATGHPMDIALVLAWHTGMSIADCSQLKWEQVDLVESAIIKPREKNGSIARIAFEPDSELARMLSELRAMANKDAVFVAPDLAHIGTHRRNGQSNGLFSMFRTLCKRAGLDPGKNFYSFRHTMLTRMAEAGINTLMIAKTAGHKGLDMIARYIHPSADSLRSDMRKIEAHTNVHVPTITKPEKKSSGDNKMFQPNTVYRVKKGRIKEKYPNGTCIKFIRTGELNGDDVRVAHVQPCDFAGNPTTKYLVEVYKQDVYKLSSDQDPVRKQLTAPSVIEPITLDRAEDDEDLDDDEDDEVAEEIDGDEEEDDDATGNPDKDADRVPATGGQDAGSPW